MYNFLYENDFENKAANILDRAEDIGISVGNKETNKEKIIIRCVFYHRHCRGIGGNRWC